VKLPNPGSAALPTALGSLKNACRLSFGCAPENKDYAAIIGATAAARTFHPWRLPFQSTTASLYFSSGNRDRAASAMHIRKFDFDYSRRFFMEKTALGLGGAGVLGSLWSAICQAGDTASAYPEELLDIEIYTKGKVKVGDVIDQDNVELVQDLLDPIIHQEILQDRRKIFIQPSVHEAETMYPPYFLDATIRNQGQATFDADGNVYTKDGKAWIGGLPFPDAQTGNEAIANITLSWGRHDKAIYAIPAVTIDPEGSAKFEYDWIWAEQQCAGLVHPSAPGPYLDGHDDLSRMQVIWFTYTPEVRGHAFLSHWNYDQRKIPNLWGYLPNVKRVRRFPANQRFEPYMPGMNLFLSDAWASGDPMLTWGNYKIIHRGPMLGSSHNQWMPQNDNWRPPLVGGKQDQSYFYVGKSLIPEVIVFEGEPTGYPRAPVSKRRVFLDARNMGPGMAITYDRKDEMWKGFEGGGGQAQAGSQSILSDDGRPEWSWWWAMSHDVAKNNVSRLHHGKTCRGSWDSALDPKDDIVEEYMTKQALRRLGI
jgi:hypothetical protein